MAQEITDVRMPMPDDPAVLRLQRRRPRDGDRVTMHGRLAPSGHAIEITCEYRDDRYQVAAVRITAQDGHEITSADLGMPVKETAERVLAKVWALFGPLDQDSLVARVHDFERRQRYTSLTDAHMRDVADAHQAATERGAPSANRAIAEQFTVSISTAERWVREARRRGFLAPSPRQRKDG